MAAGQSYTPGVCNINTEEIRRRRTVGHIGAAIYIVLLVILIILKVPRLWGILLFLPGFAAASGYLQAKNHFCTGYASSGKQNATEGSNEASAVTDQQALAKDRARARNINLHAAGIGLVLAVIAVAVV